MLRRALPASACQALECYGIRAMFSGCEQMSRTKLAPPMRSPNWMCPMQALSGGFPGILCGTVSEGVHILV